MIYTEFDPLEEVIVGDIYSPGDLDKFLPPKSLYGFNKILEERVTPTELKALTGEFTAPTRLTNPSS